MIKGFKYRYIIESFVAAFIVGIIIPGIYLARAHYNGIPFTLANVFEGVFFSFCVTFCLYFINTWIIEIIQKREKKFTSQVSRIIFELFVTIIVSVLFMYVYVKVYMLIRNVGGEMEKKLGVYDSIIIAIIVTLICVSITELIFFLKKWKKSVLEAEQLKRQNIETQYAALASQVNPHFLFNSLNALNSLIQNDPEKALIFNREFAKIYRYVLDSKDKLVVTLQEELNFLNSYLYLQKIRFENALHYQIEINYSCMDKYLPPLSLQILVENSIKHNEVSEERPLQIKLACSDMELTVSNNYQPVVRENHSNGIGLSNLIERYSHYTDIVPVFKVENDNYIARIPLLKDE